MLSRRVADQAGAAKEAPRSRVYWWSLSRQPKTRLSAASLCYGGLSARSPKFGAGNLHIASASVSPIHKHSAFRIWDRQNHPADGRADQDCYKQVTIGKSKFDRYSQKAITAIQYALKRFLLLLIPARSGTFAVGSLAVSTIRLIRVGPSDESRVPFLPSRAVHCLRAEHPAIAPPLFESNGGLAGTGPLPGSAAVQHWRLWRNQRAAGSGVISTGVAASGPPSRCAADGFLA